MSDEADASASRHKWVVNVAYYPMALHLYPSIRQGSNCPVRIGT